MLNIFNFNIICKNKFSKNIILLFLLSLVCALPGCISLSVKSQKSFTQQSIHARQSNQRALKRWHATGAMSVIYKNKNTVASYQWWQSGPRNFKLRLFGPLNMGTVLISGTSSKVTLQRGKKIYTATNVSTLMRQQLGWSFPVDRLYYWARGLPVGVSSAKGKAKYDSYGHLVSLTSDGWRIGFYNYTTVSLQRRKMDLPRILRLNSQGYPDRPQVKWVVRMWQGWK